MNKYAIEYADFFENLTKEDTKELYKNFFDVNSSFEDPFQKVKGIDAIYKVFEHMYETLDEPKFIVDEIIQNDSVAYLKWHFYFKLSQSAEEQSFIGVSRVKFDSIGMVISHVDYWDAAYNIYEKIPLLGSILRMIKKRLHA